MNRKQLMFCFLCYACFGLQNLIAQEEHEFHPHHSLGLIISHTQISQGIQEDGKRKWLSLPSWGINYNYVFHSKWAIGLHNDIIVEDFVVESASRETEALERSYPIASAVVVSFKPGKHFSFLLGSGGEFAENHNFFLLRAGFEYGLHINNRLELVANLVNDLKIKAYNSWAIGLGVVYIL